MPSKVTPSKVLWASEEEKEAVTKMAETLGRSLSNHFRIGLGLPPLLHGGGLARVGKQVIEKKKLTKKKQL